MCARSYVPLRLGQLESSPAGGQVICLVSLALEGEFHVLRPGTQKVMSHSLSALSHGALGQNESQECPS